MAWAAVWAAVWAVAWAVAWAVWAAACDRFPPRACRSPRSTPARRKLCPPGWSAFRPRISQEGLVLPEQGEKLRILSLGQTNLNPLAQKALKRLATDKAPTSLSQLVMWRVSAGLEWETIAQLSEKWANSYELTLAQDFVERLETLPEGETGRVLLQFTGSDAASESTAAEVGKAIQGITLLGLQVQVGEIPAQPEGPAVACRVRLTATDAMVQVASSDATAKTWVPFGKFSLPTAAVKGKFDTVKFVDGFAEGILNRLVRTQLSRGPREKGKETYKRPDRQCVPLDPQRTRRSGDREQGRTRSPRCCRESHSRRVAA